MNTRSVLGNQVAWLVSAIATLAVGAGCAAQSDGTTDPRSVATYDVARDAFDKGNLREALAKVEEALDTDGDNAEAAYLGAIIHLAFCAQDEQSSDCRFEDAERYARRALAADPEMRDAKNTLGVVLVHQKKYDDAIAALKPLTTDILYRSPEMSWGNLGWAYLEKGSFDEAIDALRRAVASQPAFCVGNHRLGLAYEKKGEHKSALAAFVRAVETDKPGCGSLQEAWEGRGRANAKLGDVSNARADYEKCRDLSPGSATGRRCASALGALPAAVEAPPAPPPPAEPPASSAAAPAAPAPAVPPAPAPAAPATPAPKR